MRICLPDNVPDPSTPTSHTTTSKTSSKVMRIPYSPASIANVLLSAVSPYLLAEQWPLPGVAFRTAAELTMMM